MQKPASGSVLCHKPLLYLLLLFYGLKNDPFSVVFSFSFLGGGLFDCDFIMS